MISSLISVRVWPLSVPLKCVSMQVFRLQVLRCPEVGLSHSQIQINIIINDKRKKSDSFFVTFKCNIFDSIVHCKALSTLCNAGCWDRKNGVVSYKTRASLG